MIINNYRTKYISLFHKITEKNLLAALFLYAISSLIIIPYDSHTFRYAGPVLLFFFLIFFIKEKLLLKFDLTRVLGALLLLYSAYFCELPLLGTISLFFCVGEIVKNNNFSQEIINKRTYHIFLFICMISIIWQMVIYRGDGERITLSVQATNYSGMYLFLYFLASKKANFKWGELLCIIASFIISSRNLLYSMIVFYIFDFVTSNFKDKSFIRFFKNYIPILIIFNFILLIGAYLAFDIMEIRKVFYDKSIFRLATPIDSAAIKRLEILMFYLKRIYQETKYFWLGFGESYMSFFANSVGSDIHNSFFAITAKYGVIWCSLFFIYLKKTLSKFFTVDNIPFMISQIFFGLFLHTLFETQPLLIFTILLTMKRFSSPKRLL